jgi:hypothetical protein
MCIWEQVLNGCLETISEREVAFSKEAIMRGIPRALGVPLYQVLMDCDEFFSPSQLRGVFSAPELLPWQNRLPGGEDLQGRVTAIVGYLANQEHTTSGNVLVLLLRILGEQHYPNPDDKRHNRLLTLASQLEWFNQRPAKPEAAVLEANPEHAQMLWTADAEKMLNCARSVARVEVLHFRKGERKCKSTGTGWLAAPGLALTCWHVIDALSDLEFTIDADDFQAQIQNALLTFDYTAAGEGLQYCVSGLEYPTLDSHPLDYALLRLTDRAEMPLRDRGYLELDPGAPLTKQSSLYIIQHPLGQPQQSIGDTYVGPSPSYSERILYKTPTEPGTSGAPVFNRVNWSVVALHNGENEAERLREGTLIQAVLADLEQNRPDLYGEIMNAQTAKE